MYVKQFLLRYSLLKRPWSINLWATFTKQIHSKEQHHKNIVYQNINSHHQENEGKVARIARPHESTNVLSIQSLFGPKNPSRSVEFKVFIVVHRWNFGHEIRHNVEGNVEFLLQVSDKLSWRTVFRHLENSLFWVDDGHDDCSENEKQYAHFFLLVRKPKSWDLNRKSFSRLIVCWDEIQCYG